MNYVVQKNKTEIFEQRKLLTRNTYKIERDSAQCSWVTSSLLNDSIRIPPDPFEGKGKKGVNQRLHTA